jgi:hypothetical protein
MAARPAPDREGGPGPELCRAALARANRGAAGSGKLPSRAGCDESYSETMYTSMLTKTKTTESTIVSW